jgi:heme exporter protein CcmD
MADFLAMGGYAQWVWTAYAATLAVLAGNVIAASRRYRHTVERLRERRNNWSGSVTR